MIEKLKSVSELAAILGCEKITVYRLVKSGKISCRRVGALVKFADTDIETYLESVKVNKKT